MHGYQDCDQGNFPGQRPGMGTYKFHPYNAYADDYSGPVNQQQMMPPIGYNNQGMNPNAPAYMPRAAPRHESSGGFNPLGYSRPQQAPQRQPQQPPSGYNYHQGYQNQASYASAASQYVPQQQQQQSVVTNHMTSAPQQESKPDLMALKNTLSEEKKQKENDQEAYASRFLQAVQERMQDVNLDQLQQNGVANIPQFENNGYYENSLEMYEFEAQHQSSQQFHVSEDLLNRIQQMQNNKVIFEVQIGLEQLISETSEYETWSIALKDRLQTKEGREENMEVGSWMIIEVAMESKDTQSLLAKLSAYLFDSLDGFNDFFTSNLDFFQTHRNTYADRVLQNLLLFTGELYERALLPNRSRNVHFAVMVIDLIRTLIERPATDASVKTIVDVLKLCGYHLQLDSYRDAVNDIVKKLEGFLGRRPDGLTDTACSYITSLLKSRGEWGKEAANDVANARYPVNEHRSVNPMDLTDEEIGFLEKHGAMEPFYANGFTTNDFDDEILDDYEKFLRDNEHTAVSTAEKILEKLSIDEDDSPIDNTIRKDENKTPTPGKSNY